MNEMSIVTFAERDLSREWSVLQKGAWPEFITHDATWGRHQHLLDEDAADYQFVLFDAQSAPIGAGNCIPFEWDGADASLPDGIDGVLPASAEMFAAKRTPTAVSALQIVVRRDLLGRGVSALCLRAMATIVRRHELRDLVAPVRPTQKNRYPLIPLDHYARWRRADGQLLDPWLRVHERAGARPIGVCPKSMTVTGTVAEWEAWTEMALPETGSYVVPSALVPVDIDVERDEGRYVEPNFWMHHRCPPAGSADR